MQMAVEMVRRDQLLQGDIDERGECAIFAIHHGRAFSFHPDQWRLPTSRYRTTQERVFQQAAFVLWTLIMERLLEQAPMGEQARGGRRRRLGDRLPHL